MSRTDRATLSLGRRLGQGGQGTVHEVLDRKINRQWDVAYKEYDPDVLQRLDVTALTAMTDLIGRLQGWDAAWLCDKTAWPAGLVEADGAVTGFLMRAVPHRFSFDLRTLSGTVRKLTTMEFLLNDDAYVGQIGLRVSERDRLLLLADLADTLARLHSMDIVVGDLSPKNLLFSTEGSPECFLIDCDAMRLGGTEALPQVETPDWQIPSDEQKGTPQSDAYKFALLTVRVFARDQSATDLGRLAAVSPALADLASAGLHQPPSQRPAPAQWATLLRQTALSASTAPTTVAPPPLPPPGPPGPPGVPGSFPQIPPQTSGSPFPAKVIGLGVGAGVLALVLAVVGVNAAVKSVSSNAPSSGASFTLAEPSYTYSPSPEPSESASEEPTQEPSDEPTEEPFSIADLDSSATDPTPLTPTALLPESFTTAKGVRYNLKASGVGKCPDSYHDSNVRSALRKARCTKMIKGAYVNPNAPANRRIMVSVWVVPLKNADRADTAYSRLDTAYADDWGIVCPRKGPGAGLCDSGSWNRAQTWGWIGSTHRYLLHTMAIYTNRASSTSVRPWLKDASKAAFNAAGPMVYHDN
ncbi:hypothetical protein [Nonomuraea zeae]|uniref:Protein kinase domain-containing protein n=1 Tax=Nonomuraea zeae TaxID=1642303 RepID=A0A5S4GGH9_9ACTN|nr:hypothetical protein [Nonomuraea zeae]TMR31614.1 hypothetical protein ETD85_25445 [Nonomuraea zeae]